MSSKIPAGVITGKQVQEVFALAKEKKFALPAVNVIGNNTVNTVLETAAELNSPVIIQFSNGGAVFNAGKSLDNTDQKAAIADHYKRLIKSGIILSRSKTLMDDLAVASAVVTYNSSPGVAAAIEGLPVFVTDPIPQQSQAFGVANTSLAQIETPREFDREEWIRKLAMTHWTQEDLRSGECWAWMRQWATK